jgi:hypothetical protein
MYKLSLATSPNDFPAFRQPLRAWHLILWGQILIWHTADSRFAFKLLLQYQSILYEETMWLGRTGKQCICKLARGSACPSYFCIPATRVRPHSDERVWTHKRPLHTIQCPVRSQAMVISWGFVVSSGEASRHYGDSVRHKRHGNRETFCNAVHEVRRTMELPRDAFL